MIIPKGIQKRIREGRVTLKDEQILDQLSMCEILGEQLRLNSIFIQKHQKLYKKFLKKEESSNA